MKNILLGVFTALLISVGGIYTYQNYFQPKNKSVENTQKQSKNQKQNEDDKPAEKTNKTQVNIKEPSNSAFVNRSKHVYQTFNNCGPATLSMILAGLGTNVSQDLLGDEMRPYQNPSGDNDDKSVFSEEIVKWAEEYGYEGIYRPNGDIELLKKLTTNGFPVIVTTWLNPGEDVGHYRIVRGYNNNKQVIIQDDSYQGTNIEFGYNEFNSIWQPFGYDYVVIFSPEDKNLVEAIIGEDINEKTAWENTLERAKKEEQEASIRNPYPTFNISVASYHLGNYGESVEAFEKVESQLPRRMLWYQIEPIRAYKELGNYDRVFELANEILNNGNRAFSRLYMIKGEIYLEQGNEDLAKENFELALHYNENFEAARKALRSL